MGGSGVGLGAGVSEGERVSVGGSEVAIGGNGSKVGDGMGVSVISTQIFTRRVGVIVGGGLSADEPVGMLLVEQLTEKIRIMLINKIRPDRKFIRYSFIRVVVCISKKSRS
jgi:hypothetical protein